ncbi:hypothetical protein CDAR_440821 [Caerostris darwini]|uniref:Uncharacterized protein n=1 Tax=Caerostris darwini TaxID=1538125 RepID=A0AAV4MML9_9ARAC|nr:hypothetical protein CDAR_440821 [Caerostris darwini]
MMRKSTLFQDSRMHFRIAGSDRRIRAVNFFSPGVQEKKKARDSNMVIPYRCGKGPGLAPRAAIKRPKAGRARRKALGSALHSLFLLSGAGYLGSFMARRRVLRNSDLDERSSCVDLELD